jgi:hypothetical protein
MFQDESQTTIKQLHALKLPTFHNTTIFKSSLSLERTVELIQGVFDLHGVQVKTQFSPSSCTWQGCYLQIAAACNFRVQIFEPLLSPSSFSPPLSNPYVVEWQRLNGDRQCFFHLFHLSKRATQEDTLPVMEEEETFLSPSSSPLPPNGASFSFKTTLLDNVRMPQCSMNHCIGFFAGYYVVKEPIQVEPIDLEIAAFLMQMVATEKYTHAQHVLVALNILKHMLLNNAHEFSPLFHQNAEFFHNISQLQQGSGVSPAMNMAIELCACIHSMLFPVL